MELTNALSPEQMKKFLYGELSEEEAQAIEELLFVDSNLFYKLTSFENDLIDRYMQGKLEGEELNRFEQSLTRSDERREQIKNARALQRYITEQKKSSVPVAVIETPHQSIWSRLSSLFSFKSPVMQYAMAVLIAFLGIGGAWLLYDSYRVRQELTQARGEQGQRERDLQNKLVENEQQIEVMRQAVKEQRGENEELNAALKQREEEISRLKQELQRGLQNEPIAMAIQPTIMALDVRGEAKEKVIKYSAKSVTVRLRLLTETDYQVYEIRENEKVLTTGKKISDNKSGKTYLMVKLPARDIVFKVWGIDRERGREKEIREYRLEMQQKK